MNQATTPGDHSTLIEFGSQIPPGRYAWSPAEGVPLKFVWIKDYKSGKRAGQRRIRFQHGSWYSEAATILPNGAVRVFDTDIEPVLIGVYCDRSGTAMAYAQALGKCWRCYSELTDERSRHYGCGPECEKAVPWYFEGVDNELEYTFEEIIDNPVLRHLLRGQPVD